MPRQSSQKAIDEVVRAITAAAREIGYEHGKCGELVRLARELQSREVPMPSGGQWYREKDGATGFKRFLKLHAPSVLGGAGKAQGATKQATPAAETAPQLDAQAIRTLLEVAQWWMVRGKRAELVISRPKFRGKSVNSSIRVNGPLVNAALEKAREPEHRNRTGGNLSGLVEWLLWQFVDCDPRFIEHKQPLDV